MRHALPLVLAMAGCGQDITITQSSLCDGVGQSDEDPVDSPFDRDADGFFDGANPDCAATYPPERLDCNDGDATVNPEAAEVGCDGIDNDCDPLSGDAQDRDGDGWNECDDCNDGEALAYPGAAELVCDGVDNDCDAGTPDGLDKDGDAYTECVDCNDLSPAVNPGVVEAECDGIDNDCSDLTPDGEDFDQDNYDVCEDCNDSQATVNPGTPEVCDDRLDNDCDTAVDEGCTYSGVYNLDQRIQYECAVFFGVAFVDVDFQSVNLLDTNPTIQISPVGGGSQPGNMSGSFSTSVDFSVLNTISGGCTEKYSIAGSFTSATEFTGTFTADFVGSASQCQDCTKQVWNITASQ